MSDSMAGQSPERPVLVFDGESRICGATVDRWREAAGGRIRFAAYQEAAAEFPNIAADDVRQVVHFVDADGKVTSGAEAALRAAAHCGRKRWLLWSYERLPRVAAIAEAVYRFAVESRGAQTIVRRIWWGKDLRPPTYFIASTLFLRLLGVVYLIAFVSLWTQIDGLIGDQGISPVSSYLEAVEKHFASQTPPEPAVWNVPTLAWLSPHDGLLHWLCGGGTVLSVLLIVGVLPIPALVLLWLAYLSLYHAGQVFLGFQWDILLLETGFAAIFVAPFTLRSKFFADRHPPRLAMWLIWWLLFRLMVESGAVKLTWNICAPPGPDGGPIHNCWSTLTALDFHYWTQPLPIWTSWYVAKLPEWFQKLSTIFVFVVELGLPWLIFGPRLLRYLACGGIVLLMLLIAATGNYSFFNLLTIVMALTLLDDKAWPRFLQRRIRGTDPPWLFAPVQWRSVLLVPFASFVLVLGGLQVKEAIAPSDERSPPLEAKWKISQFCFVNGYGLFRQMTETRPEIMIDGSNDGMTWSAYEFRWKPGSVFRAPRFCTPHQPRLDWQMWFEALRLEQVQASTGTIEPRFMSPWFQSFLFKLFKGEAAVVGLLEKNPFPDAPPKFIRLRFYHYRFTTYDEWRDGGNWWHRDEVWVGPGWSLGR
jgi:predicted DCC family thiol-disulfide oxidoreductase YuxK